MWRPHSTPLMAGHLPRSDELEVGPGAKAEYPTELVVPQNRRLAIVAKTPMLAVHGDAARRGIVSAVCQLQTSVYKEGEVS